MKKSRTKGANAPVPQSREEAAQFIHEIGMLQRQVARAEADMNDEIAAAKNRAEKETLGLRETIDRMTQGLRTWCEANRDALTENNKRKFADLGTGKIEWKFAPPKVTIRGADDVILRIKTLGLAIFLREKVEIDKEAMLKEPEKARLISGVAIGSAGENFYVEPFESEIKGSAQ
jgi:phage host-nuclease inhibitor protein Gam